MTESAVKLSNGGRDGWMDGWREGWMGQRMDGYVNETYES